GAAEVRAKFGVDPEFIPDYLALVGDAADGYPGISGCGAKTAANLINRYGALENFGPDVLNEENRVLAILFKDLATLRTDAPLFKDVDELRWRGATPEFAQVAEKVESARLLARVKKLQKRLINT
ncbi:MAG TPA: 5'-3' exonuclease H3TH domain-containing protein, partial [Pyrinomonadaceae bacterium]|nr:5'-3' exonuclease H3TH domain-containing protein [Pyrinomonadaceae bacterium]